jgi:hypothetical protein
VSGDEENYKEWTNRFVHETESDCSTRLERAVHRVYPDFYGIGAMKTGTTGLWSHLPQHPDTGFRPERPTNSEGSRRK